MIRIYMSFYTAHLNIIDKTKKNILFLHEIIFNSNKMKL